MKNLRTLLYMLTLLLSVVGVQSAEAQESAVQDALYIYRNDGGFHGFFYGDIERFDYSCIDTLGVEHEDYVVQEVVTVDSIYRIPISAIDSIGFVTPETVYKKDVAHTTTSKLWDYVIGSDSVTMMRLASNTPKELVPKVGDKIVTTKSRDFLPCGFYGLVKSIVDETEGITVKCEVPPFTDLFDQWVCKAAVRAISEDEETGTRSRSSEQPYISDIDIPGANIDIDLTELENFPYAITDSWSVKGKGKVHYGMNHYLHVRLFAAVRWALGFNFDCVTRLETTSNFEFNVSGEVSGQLDAPIKSGWVWITDTPFALEYEFGLSASVAGKLEFEHKRQLTTSVCQTLQYNNSFYDDEYSSHNESFHNLGEEVKTSLTGEATLTAGPYLRFCCSLLKKEIGDLGFRFDAGLKTSVKAELTLTDYLLATVPGVLPAYMIMNPTAMYDLLNRDGSVSFGPFFKCDFEAQVFKNSNFKYSTTLFDEGTLKKLTGYDMLWTFEGGLVPEFKHTSLEFDDDMIPTASVDIRRPAMLYPPVGFAAYYTASGKQLGKTLWQTDVYMEDRLNHYALPFPKFGGGKEVRVYPVVKVLRKYELLGSPYASHTVPAELKSVPEKLTFEAEGGEETLTVSDNLDRSEDKYTDEYGVTAGEDEKDVWLSVEKEGETYKVTAKPNTTDEEREGSVDFYVYNEDRSIDLVLNVPVTQKAPELMFSVSPENLEVPGYSKEFKNGELTKQITVVYPNTATDVKVSSSAESWLTVDKNWVSSTSDDMNTTGVKTVHIKPNFSLETPREGVITVEMTNADGSVATGTMTVSQLAFDPKVEVKPTDLILTAEEKKNAAYSHKATVKIQMDPMDSYVRAAIKKEDVKASVDWIEATVKDDVIEVRAQANPKEEERTGTLTYTVEMKDGGSMSKTINVRQLEKQIIMAFTFNPESVRFPVKGGEKQVFVVGDDVERIITIDCKDSEWLGGGASGLSITLLAKESEEEQERITPVFITAKMKDGTTETEYFLVYQDGTKTGATGPDPDGIRKVFFKTIVKCHSDFDEGIEETGWEVGEETFEMFSLFTKENTTFKTKVDGNNLHVECSGHQEERYGSWQTAELSFDIINYNSGNASDAKITNVKYSSSAKMYMGEEDGYLNVNDAVNLANIPVLYLEPVFILASGSEGGGVQFSNFSMNMSASTGSSNTHYDSDPSNSADIRISFEGNDDDDWGNLIDNDDDDDDEDWSYSRTRPDKQKNSIGVTKRRILQQKKSD